jgi:sugar phosphate isomerase/epimerase
MTRGEGPRMGQIVKLLGKVQVNIPFPMLLQNLEMVLGAGLQPEIYFNSHVLDHLQPEDVRRASRKLAERNIPVTFHAPFMDLNPGAVDEKIREVTRYRFNQVLDLAPFFHPRMIVFHPGYDRFRYDDNVDLWLENSLLTWKPIIDRLEEVAKDGTGSVKVAVENVFEEHPSILKRLLAAVHSPYLGYCLDAGHSQLFSGEQIGEWIEVLAPWLLEIHLHDNHGKADEHLPVGQGKIDFAGIFALLKKKNLDPIYTIEPHQQEHLEPTLKGLEKYLVE